MPLGDNGYDLSVITPFRAKRFEQSIQTNPDFFNGPFTGVVVQPAAYTFIYRFMGNKSEEYPDGYLDADVLKTFFSVSGEPGSFEWNAGHERIPENWYKRAIGDEYTIPRFQLDFLAAALEFPQFLSVGGNTDGVDTFTGVDLTDLTGGVYNLESLAEGNNAICFAFQAAGQMAPDILGGLFSQIRKPLSQINDAIGDVLGGLSCPQLNDLDASFFDIFPGAKTAE